MNKLTSALMCAGWNSHIEDKFRVYQKDKNTLRIQFVVEQEDISMLIKLDVKMDMLDMYRHTRYDELIDRVREVILSNRYGEEAIGLFVIWRRAFQVARSKEEENVDILGDSIDRRKKEIGEIMRIVSNPIKTSNGYLEVLLSEDFDLTLDGSYSKMITLIGDRMPVHVVSKIKIDFESPTEKEFYNNLLLELRNSIDELRTSYQFDGLYNVWLLKFIRNLKILTDIDLNLEDYRR